MTVFVTWAALGIAFLPLMLRLLFYNYFGVKTPFDLPVVLMMSGGLVGLCVSPNLGVSVGALYSLLASTAFYYSVANYPRPEKLVKWGLPLLAIALFTATFLALSHDPLPTGSFGSNNPWISKLVAKIPKLPQVYDQHYLALGVNHGLALSLLIASAIGAGVAAFSKQIWLRLVSGFGSMFFLTMMVMFTNSSLLRLFTLVSIKGRIALWQRTIEMLGEHPFTGLGLGSWVSVYHSGAIPQFPIPTHPHNAYLELYANLGTFGAVAFLVSLFVIIRMSWDILRLSPVNTWYGIGTGVMLASLLSGLVGFLESAPVGIPLLASNVYFYVVSPVPWIMMGLLTVTYKLSISSAAIGGRT
jgi:hypothetical protein